MDIEVHRAGRTYYGQSTVLLNIPHRRLDAFFSLPEWPAIAAAKLFHLPEVSGTTLADYGAMRHATGGDSSGGLPGIDLDELLRRHASGEFTAEDLVREMQTLREKRRGLEEAGSPSGVAVALATRSGVPLAIWERAGQEMFEAVMPLEAGPPSATALPEPSVEAAREIGLARVALASDYPIITATYGYTRADYAPNRSQLNPFPAHPDHGGRFPIFVDQIQADAILVTLDHERVIAWLERNGARPLIPAGTDRGLARQAYSVALLDALHLGETIPGDQREARMVFCLLHTLSHLSVRHAALLCGLDRTSLSEYLLSRALTFALYSNHRFGATIGALTALFEQSFNDWIAAISASRRCIYDPVCIDRSGNCHACTHLAETSCRFYNLNLSRAFIFGGNDTQLGRIPVGYFDPSLPSGQ